MASEGGGKIKAKKSNVSSKPYERRKSLLGKVKETMKDLLAPSWLTDFMSTVSKKHSSKEPDDTEVLIDDDEEDKHLPSSLSNSIVQPVSNEKAPSAAFHSQTSTTKLPQNPFSSSQLQFSQLHSQTHGESTSYGGASQKATSHSASSSSTVIPRRGENRPGTSQQKKPEPQVEYQRLPPAPFLETRLPTRHAPAADRQLESAPSEARADESVVEKEQPNRDDSDRDTSTLLCWTTQNQRKGRHLKPAVKEKPSFNVLLSVSPLSTSVPGETTHESTFYSGRTTYGGVSAYRRPRLNVSAPYQKALPIRKPVKAKIQNTSFTTGAVTSSMSQRILETLERMSTPLSDAKKIPSNDSSMADSVLSFTPNSYRRQSRRMSFQSTSLTQRPFEMRSRSPPTTQLRTPYIASIARNRQSLSATPTSSRIPYIQDVTSQEVETSETRKQKPETMVTRTDALPLEQLPGSGGFSGKMKRNKSYSQHVSKRQEEEEIIEVPNLQTDVTLKIGSMPKFQFGNSPTDKFPVVSKTVTSTQVSSAVTSSSVFKPSVKSASLGGSSNLSTEANLHSKLKFTFSAPIIKSCPQQNMEKSQRKVGFKFSSPLKVDDKFPAMGEEKMDDTSTKGLTESSAFGSPNKQKSPIGNGGFGIANKLREGSVVDNLGKGKVTSADVFKPANDLNSKTVQSPCTFKDSIFGGFKAASSLKTGSVMDILGSKSAPPKSDSSKPSDRSKDESSKEDKNTDNLLAKFKSPPGSWECDTCMIRNKADVDICVACQSKRNIKGNLTNSSPQDDLLSKFAKPAGAWECDVCMLQNKSDAKTCVACTAARPAGKSASSSGFGSTSTVTSSVFKKPTGTWECDTCMVQNKAESTRCVACEVPRPCSKPAGSFGNVGSAKTENPIGTISKGGGFKIIGQNAIPSSIFKSNTSSESGSGMKVHFGQTEKNDSKTSESSVVGSSNTGTVSSGGFKFGNTNDFIKKPVQESGLSFGGTGKETSGEAKADFNFGAADKNASSLSETNTSEVKTGFSFASLTSQTSKESEIKQSGFSFGNNIAQTTSAAEPKSGGFSFGAPASQMAKDNPLLNASTVAVSLSNNAEIAKSTPQTLQSGFSFGSNANVTFGDSTSKTTSTEKTGTGFSFSSRNVTIVNSSITSGMSAHSKTTENPEIADKNFNFTGVSNKANISGQLNSTGFAFGQPATNSNTIVTNPIFGAPKSVEEKAGLPKPNASIFAFGQPVDAITGQNATSGFSVPSSSTSAKRSQEESGGSDAKKPFTFGMSGTAGSGSFNFGGATPVSTNGPTTPFVFGANSSDQKSQKPAASAAGIFGSFSQQPPAATDTAKSTSSSLFAFGSSQNNSLQFGNPGATPAFGNGPTAPGTLGFGASTPQAPPPSAPFGSTNTGNPAASAGVFGSAVPAFGSASGSTAPSSFTTPSKGVAFGATPGFASSLAQQNTTGFKFNATASTNFGGNASGPLFQFSGTNPSDSSAGAPTQAPGSHGFTFTAQSQSAATTPAFNSQPTNFPTGIFALGSSSESGGRKIKKAVRKIKK